MVIGLYKEADGLGGEETCRIRSPDGSELDVSRAEYEAAFYEPPFDDLPTKTEFEAHHA